MRSPCRPARQVSGAAQPAMWELVASSVLTLPGGKAMPALVANQTGVAVIDGDGQILEAGWTRGIWQTIG
jgi:hypothetical protein